ncbi:MAG: hypothetical protein A2992_05115 [Elusimicrobia bacterium RIFCSPLOWO2_01_FULL_59_12]|nr:MAG: hypothetical protein A2992_05115 [Elusimicrobia bacterium RIFCSPLOWO2_01_FULL_59_12]
MSNSLHDQHRWKVTKPDGYDIIKGKRGVIEQYSDGDLNVLVTSHRVIFNCLWKSLHTYDDGADYCRPYSDLAQACELIKARRRRQVTEEMRQRGRELAAKMRSSNATPALARPSAEQNPPGIPKHPSPPISAQEGPPSPGGASNATEPYQEARGA